MLEQQRFCGEDADATRTKDFRESDEQVDRQKEEIAHESNATTTVTMIYEFAADTPGAYVKLRLDAKKAVA